ncbi:MAG: DUF1731 domain-containing protein, partial [Bdellovibrionales bacterium]|nr:DUF1731 domain-containing protein [Bdellovibrionales bacterium]
HCIEVEAVEGPVNLVAPNPVTNAELTKELGQALRRPTLIPVPAPVVRLLLGEMGEQLLLAGTRVYPDRLVQSGYTFRFPTLPEALRHVLSADIA